MTQEPQGDQQPETTGDNDPTDQTPAPRDGAEVAAAPAPEETSPPASEEGFTPADEVHDYERDYGDQGETGYEGEGGRDYEADGQDEEGDEYEYEDEYDYEGEDEEEEEEEEEDDDVDEHGMKKMTLVEHLEELRTRIIRAMLGLVVGVAVALIFGKQIFAVIEAPYVAIMGNTAPLKAMSYTETVGMYLQIGFYCGLVIASPWVFYELWMFVAAGLYKHERRYVLTAVPFCTGLFVTGAAFYLFVVSRPTLRFLLGFNTWLGIEPLITFSNHVDFMTNMMLVFGLCFQLPVAMLVLAKMGVVTIKTLHHYRRHAIVVILIVAAVLTPSPSPVDQLALAIPMWLLYELGVVLVYFLVTRKQRAEETGQAADE